MTPARAADPGVDLRPFLSSLRSGEGGPAQARPEVPVLPGYALEHRLGVGGMGEVWSAVDRANGRRVAVKLLAEELVGDPRARRRFEAEGELLRGLRHPGVVGVLDVATLGTRPALVLEAIDGVPLGRVVRGTRADPGLEELLLSLAARSAWGDPCAGPLDRCLLGWAWEVADALAHAHERGVLHRDVTPSNVLIDASGRARLIDFGIGRAAGGDGLTRTGEVLGTPGYMAPEAWTGETQVASDVSSVAAVLFEGLTGRKPYGGTGRPWRPGAPPPPEPSLLARRPALGAALEWPLRRALALQPGGRYPSARAFAEDLARVASGRRPIVRPPPWHARLSAWVAGRRRLRRAALIAGACLLACGVAAGVWGWAVAHDPVRARDTAARLQREQGRRAVTEAIARVRSPGSESWRLEREVLPLLRAHATPETVEALCAALDAVSAEYEALHERLGGHPWHGEALSSVRARQRAAERLRIEGGLAGADVLARALRDVAEGPRPAQALVRYLALEVHEDFAALAGAALARQAQGASGPRAREALAQALGRFGHGGPFWQQAVLGERGSEAWALGLIEGAPSAGLAFGGRQPNGAVAGPLGLTLLVPAAIDPWLMLGLSRSAVRERAAEREEARRRVAEAPADARAWKHWARASLGTGHLTDAVAALDASVALDPTDVEAWELLGDARRVLGDLAGSVAASREALRLAPDRWEPLARLGLALADSGRHREALDSLEDALRRRPRHPMPAAYQAMALLQAARPAEAARAARAALAEDPRASEARHTLVVSLLVQGRVDEALAEARTVALDAPGYPLGFNGLGVALLLHGDLDGASSALDQAIDHDPALPFAWLNRGVLALARDDPRTALRCLDAALLRLPNLPASHAARAVALAWLGEAAGSAAALDRLATLSGPEAGILLAARAAAAGRPRR